MQGWQSRSTDVDVIVTSAAAVIEDDETELGHMDGVIVRIVKDKGFGFIRNTENQREYFFHRSVLTGGAIFEYLTDGQVVTFEDEPNPKGLRARNVALVTK